MKKNNTSIDIVAFGDLIDDNIDKLKQFNDVVKGGDGSHLEIVPPGPNLLSDSIVASPILAGEGGGAAANGAGAEGGAGGGGGDSFEFGVDPSMDPELALALRMSFEEEKNRQERERKAQEEREGKTNLESVPEESKPLLDSNGEPSGSASSEVKNDTEVKRPEEEEKKDKEHEDTLPEGTGGTDDRMDTE